MIIQNHLTAASFLDCAGSSLGGSEIENSLVLGLAARREARERQGTLSDSEPAWLFVSVHDQPSGPPRGAAMMTPGHPLLLAGGRESRQICIALSTWLLRNHYKLPGVLGREDLATCFADHWCLETHQRVRVIRQERIHQLKEPDLRAPTGVQGSLRHAGSASDKAGKDSDHTTIARWMRQFHDEAVPEDPVPDIERLVRRHIDEGSIFLWDIGRPVSMAVHVRSARSAASVSGVFTPSSERGKGYASACVAALCKRLFREGFATCVLYTDLANPTSNRIYRRIGFAPVCDARHLSFAPTDR